MASVGEGTDLPQQTQKQPQKSSSKRGSLLYVLLDERAMIDAIGGPGRVCASCDGGTGGCVSRMRSDSLEQCQYVGRAQEVSRGCCWIILVRTFYGGYREPGATFWWRVRDKLGELVTYISLLTPTTHNPQAHMAASGPVQERQHHQKMDLLGKPRAKECLLAECFLKLLCMCHTTNTSTGSRSVCLQHQASSRGAHGSASVLSAAAPALKALQRTPQTALALHIRPHGAKLRLQMS